MGAKKPVAPSQALSASEARGTIDSEPTLVEIGASHIGKHGEAVTVGVCSQHSTDELMRDERAGRVSGELIEIESCFEIAVTVHPVDGILSNCRV